MSTAQNRNIMNIIPTPQLRHIMCIPQGPQSCPLTAAVYVQGLSKRTPVLLMRHHQHLASMAHLRYALRPPSLISGPILLALNIGTSKPQHLHKLMRDRRHDQDKEQEGKGAEQTPTQG